MLLLVLLGSIRGGRGWLGGGDGSGSGVRRRGFDEGTGDVEGNVAGFRRSGRGFALFGRVLLGRLDFGADFHSVGEALEGFDGDGVRRLIERGFGFVGLGEDVVEGGITEDAALAAGFGGVEFLTGGGGIQFQHGVPVFVAGDFP